MKNNPNPKISNRYRFAFDFHVHRDLMAYDLEKFDKIGGVPKLVFLGSMTDLFQGRVPLDVLQAIVDKTQENSQHYYMFLTKRPARMSRLLHDGLENIGPNLGFGTTIEMAEYQEDDRVIVLQDRAEYLADIKEAHPGNMTFVSYEPALGPLSRGEYTYFPDTSRLWGDLDKVDWIIAGGESGSDCRLPERRFDWFKEVRDFCVSHGVTFHYKQGGGNSYCKHSDHKAKGCRLLDGQLWDQFPRQILQHFGGRPF